MKPFFAIILIAILHSFSCFAEEATQPWKAQWISHPSADLLNYGVFHFRKSLVLDKPVASFKVRITADSKYKLYVNGTFVSYGPADGDPDHWFYETLDLAPFLKPGKNSLAALVWNMGEGKGWNQMGYKTAFLMEGDSSPDGISVNTGSDWKVIQGKGLYPCSANTLPKWMFRVAGASDSLVSSEYLWNWEAKDFNDTGWPKAKVLEAASNHGEGSGTPWGLTPSGLPPMERKNMQTLKLRKSSVLVSDGFLSGERPLVLGPNQKFRIVLDNKVLTNAWIKLKVASGKGAKIRLTYAEAFFTKDFKKGNRNEIEGKECLGHWDVFVCDGQSRLFEPLGWRTYRYIQLDIETLSDPLEIHSLSGEFTGYPFEEKASFSSSDPILSEIWKTGWRTARLCAMDTYMDCPYYERLQYLGDTRIEALISMYVSGDDRLMRQTISIMNSSRFGEGLTRSRYPSGIPQVIPPFSLFWVDMLSDYFKHRPDSAFVRNYLGGAADVLAWYEKRIDPATGMLGKTPFWNFVDWTKEWPWDNTLMTGGVPKGGDSGGSSITTLQYVYTLGHAAEMFEGFGFNDQANRYRQQAKKIREATYRLCWDPEKSLLADTPDRNQFSQHANIWGILTDAIPLDEQARVMRRVLSGSSLIQASLYFRFYLEEALYKSGMGNQYLSQLGHWKSSINLGLSTFPETQGESRSDCHAWSSSPNYHFLSVVCGIRPGSSGFSTVEIAPNPGDLNFFEGSIPHPKGPVRVKYSVSRKGKEAEVNLPPGLPGNFVWDGKTYALTSGKQILQLP